MPNFLAENKGRKIGEKAHNPTLIFFMAILSIWKKALLPLVSNLICLSTGEHAPTSRPQVWYGFYSILKNLTHPTLQGALILPFLAWKKDKNKLKLPQIRRSSCPEIRHFDRSVWKKNSIQKIQKRWQRGKRRSPIRKWILGLWKLNFWFSLIIVFFVWKKMMDFEK